MTTTNTATHRVAYKHAGGTGETHYGSPTSYTVAKSWVDAMNKQYPYLFHWVAPAEECDIPAASAPARVSLESAK